MNVEQLRSFVKTKLSSIHSYEAFKDVRGSVNRTAMDHQLKQIIFRFLYYVTTDSGSKLNLLFPDKHQFPETMDDILDVEYAKDFYKINSSNRDKDFRHQGRNCGRKFKLGEPLYRCQECGYDDTCVLCINCFNPKDHENHHIFTDICNDFTSGICDCGDEEAWLSPLHCKAEDDGEDQTMEDEDETLTFDEQIIEAVLSEAFDYFIDIFNQNIEPLPTFTKDITLKLREMIQQQDNEKIYHFLNDFSYKNPFINTSENKPEDYTVMIYNDEYHNYSQATMALRQGVPDNIHTDILTSKIDGEGRAMLKCSKDVDSLMDGFFAVQTNGLSATMTSWSEYVHQETCKYIIQWCNHCLNIPNNEFQKSFRSILGKVLCAEQIDINISINSVRNIEKYFSNKVSPTNPYRYLDVSVLDENNKIPTGHHKRPLESGLYSISNSLNEVSRVTNKKYSNSRLQYMLYFDNRYWKKLRKDLQNLIIPTLSSSLIYKPIFCEQVVQIFNHISRSITYMDREPQLTALRECIVQLFTCPTNALMIFTNENGYFIDIMWSIIDIFVDFCKFENGSLIWQRVQKSNPTRSFSMSFKQGLYTIETLLSKIEDPNVILKPMEFVSIFTLCKIFNGAWKIKRKEGEHVLHEDQHFIPYLEFTTSIYSIIQTIENILIKGECDKHLLLDAIKLVNSFLSHKSLTYKLVNESHEIIKFSVSNERVAFMNPIQTFFSLLIEKVPLSNAYEHIMYCDASSSPQPLEDIAEQRANFDFLKISDFSLRSIVLCSQIDIGFWVRNGMSVLHQASYYKNNPALDAYSRDIHLNQLCFLWEFDDTPRVIYNILDRWELLDWFNGNVVYDKTVYHDKIAMLIQQFITFIYQVLAERQFFQKFSSPKERKMHFIKNSIIHNLYSKPLSYSKLLRQVPDYYTENSADFDEALEEVSTFVEPKGLADNGVFKLNEAYYSKIDPLRLANLGNEFESSAALIKTHIAKTKNIEISKVILIPQILSSKHIDEGAANIGSFTHHPVFVKIIYKLLQTSLDNEDGTFLNELLHLIHGIFRDDEQVNGKNSIPESFISLPICNLLLSIINSKVDTYSEHILSKADFLLEKMIIKRSTEIFASLEASFGKECVEVYKKKKLNQGINLEETEKERKRRLAKKHQAKMLAKFTSQQNKFMEEHEVAFENTNNVEEDGDIDMMKGEKIVEAEEFSCSLCQDDSSEDIFIIPAYHDYTPIFRSGGVQRYKNFMPSWKGFANGVYYQANEFDMKESMKEDCRNNSRKVFVSCNHHMHHNCFKRYVQKKRFSTTAFICPLCQSYSNCVLPIQVTSQSKSDFNFEETLSGNFSIETLSNFLKASSAADMKNLYSVFDLLFTDLQSFDKSVRKEEGFTNSDTGLILATHWTNTISMLEISSRLESETEQNFLVGKEQKYKTLRNILICMILMNSTIGTPRLDFIPYNSEDLGEMHFNINQIFQYIVQEILYGKKPISETISEALFFSFKNIVEICIPSDLTHFESSYDEACKIDTVYSIPGEIKEIMDIICTMEAEGLSPQGISKSYDLIYTGILRDLVVTLRRCLIIIKIFYNLHKDSESEPFMLNGIPMETILKSEDLKSSLPNYVDFLIRLLTPFDSLHSLLRSCLRLNNINEDELHPYLLNLPEEFSGVVKLVDIPEHLNTFITNTREIKLREENEHVRNAKNRLDFKICLNCGVKVHSRPDRHEMSEHLKKKCFKSFGVFLLPNTAEVCLVLSQPPSSIFISAPYLNSHGESGRNAMKRGDLTTLNLKRYEHLNKLWITNEIPGYISRVMGDEFRMSILSNGFLFSFNRDARARRVPPANFNANDEDDGSDDSEDDGDRFGGFGDEFGDEGGDGMYSDEDDDDDGIGGGVRTNANFFDGQGTATAGDVRNFFQIFENFRNVMETANENNGEGDEDDINGNGVDFTAPFIQLLGPQFRTGRVPDPTDMAEEESEPEQDHNHDHASTHEHSEDSHEDE